MRANPLVTAGFLLDLYFFYYIIKIPIMKKNNLKKSRVAEFAQDPQKALINLALPIIFGMLVHILYNIVDAIFIGRLGAEAIAALAFSTPVFMVIISLANTSAGATAAIARSIGAQDKKQADNTAEHSLLLAFLISGLIFVFGLLYIEPFLKIIGASGEVLKLALDYIWVILFFSPLVIFSNFFNAILAGEGDTKTGARSYAIGFVVNLVLDPIFIFMLGWGVKGAAYATALAFITNFVILSKFLFIRRHSYIDFNPRDFKFQPLLIANILNIGLPNAAINFIFSINGMSFNKLASYFSFKAVAALGVGAKLDTFYFMPLMGLSIALTALTGMFVGSKQITLAKKTLRYQIKLGLCWSFLVVFLFYTFTEPLISIFTVDREVMAITAGYLRITLITYLMVPLTLGIGSFIQGTGNGLPGLVITSMRVLIINIPLAWFFTRVLGLPIYMLWWSVVISAVVSVGLAFAYLKNTLKRLNNLQDTSQLLSVNCENCGQCCHFFVDVGQECSLEELTDKFPFTEAMCELYFKKNNGGYIINKDCQHLKDDRCQIHQDVKRDPTCLLYPLMFCQVKGQPSLALDLQCPSAKSVLKKYNKKELSQLALKILNNSGAAVKFMPYQELLNCGYRLKIINKKIKIS